jgi:hypothetical protein
MRNDMRNIMQQYDIKEEIQVLTGEVMPEYACKQVYIIHLIGHGD